MSKRALLLLVAAPTLALAEPSPYGTSPYVVAYDPPPVVETAHRGFTFEIALGGGATDADSGGAGALSFALGGWLTHDVALAFRASAIGAYTMAAVSVQYDVTPRLWLGAGAGSLRLVPRDAEMPAQTGGGGFARVGYDLAEKGNHALYVSGEVQGGSVDGKLPLVASVLLGYQFL